MNRIVKEPGPDHPIAIEPHRGTVAISAGGREIARTEAALVLREAGYPPVFYVPRADARMELLRKAERETWCPYKGAAAYFDILAGDTIPAAVWSYETPHAGVAAIGGHLAFYPDKVRIEA